MAVKKAEGDPMESPRMSGFRSHGSRQKQRLVA